MAASGRTAKAKQPESLNGWQKIADFLGQPISVAERWAKSGMLTHVGRRVRASQDELNRWLGRESAGEPVQISTETTDLTSELKRGLSFVREHSPDRKKKRALWGRQVGHSAGSRFSQGKTSAMPLVVSTQPGIQPSAMLAIRPEEPTRFCIHAAEVSAPNWR
jgi:hypothetical protein